MPTISVVVPVYNVEKYLQDCIDSCLAQSFRDIEFIFVNDASPDGSSAILHENEAKHNGLIRVIDSPENLRLGGARNLGLAAARGEYVGFVDSDDMILPDMFELLYRRITETGADVCYAQSTLVNRDLHYSDIPGRDWQSAKPEIPWPERTLSTDNRELTDDDREWMLVHSFGHLVSGLWRKSFLDKMDIKWPEHLAYEDNFWGPLIDTGIERVSFVQQITYLYRTNPTSTTHAKNQTYQFDRITIEKMLLEEVRNRGLLDRYFDAWEYSYISRYAFTSFCVYALVFDKPPFDVMLGLLQDLNETFPNWRRNKYYKQVTPPMTKLRNWGVLHAPHLSAYLLHFLYRLLGK